MAGARDRILEISTYLESLGIQVNMGKNKALGNKGLFRFGKNHLFRIDISKNLDDNEKIPVLVHEFAHFLHYKYDNNLKSLEFIFEDFSDEIREELTEVTVQEIPKATAVSLYKTKELLREEISKIADSIKLEFNNFKISEPNKTIENSINFPAIYLLKYDRVKVFGRIYSVESLDNDFEYLTLPQQQYIILKSKQRALKRINAKISKLNKYYSEPSELFARFTTQYFLYNDNIHKIAPITANKMDKAIELNKLPILTKFSKIFNKVKNY